MGMSGPDRRSQHNVGREDSTRFDMFRWTSRLPSPWQPVMVLRANPRLSGRRIGGVRDAAESASGIAVPIRLSSRLRSRTIKSCDVPNGCSRTLGAQLRAQRARRARPPSADCSRSRVIQRSRRRSPHPDSPARYGRNGGRFLTRSGNIVHRLCATRTDACPVKYAGSEP